MIPEERVRLALLRVEKKQIVDDLAQINAAILHLLTGGKQNYDAARNSGDREEDYTNTSDQILSELRARRQQQEDRLNFLLDELSLLE
jgi:hypothetical protein